MILKVFDTISYAGVSKDQEPVISDKLVTRNRFAFFCALFSFFYLIFFITQQLFLPALSIFLSIVLFISSIIFNKYHQLKISAFIILLATNYSVFFTSVIFGFNTGFHLYLITSPLIVFILFDFKSGLTNVLASLLYTVNFITIIFIDQKYHYKVLEISEDTSQIFYTTNFIMAIFILIVLFFYFILNNKKINDLLIAQNKELLKQKNELLTEVDQRKEAERKLSALLEYKEVLLGEVHHRVKNNLAVISGLMELQAIYAMDEHNLLEINDNKNRIKTIALLHEKAYEQPGIVSINVSDSIKELVNHLKYSLQKDNNTVEVILNIKDIQLGFDKALSLNLIINELISLLIRKSGYNNKNLIIEIKLLLDNEKVCFSYTDNDKHDEWTSGKKSEFSKQLIDILAGQLESEYSFNLENNFNFKLNFNL